MKARAVIIALLLVVFAFAGAPQRRHAHTTTKHRGSTKTLKHHLSTIKRKKHEVRNQLKKTRHQVRVVRGNLGEIDDRLGRLEGELESTQSRLSDSRTEQKQLAASLEKAGVQLNEARELARKRLREMYIHGNHSVVGAFVGSTSYSDFISRQFINKRIADKDQRNARFVQQLCHWKIIRGERGDFLAARFHGANGFDCDLGIHFQLGGQLEAVSSIRM